VKRQPISDAPHDEGPDRTDLSPRPSDRPPTVLIDISFTVSDPLLAGTVDGGPALPCLDL